MTARSCRRVTAAIPTRPPPPPRADVRVSISAPGSVRVNNQLTVTATVTNAGPDTATGVALHAQVPGGATLSSASSSRGSCSTSGSITCPIGTLNSGGSATVTLVLTANQTGSLTAS